MWKKGVDMKYFRWLIVMSLLVGGLGAAVAHADCDPTTGIGCVASR
jgi:hypothetical protein